MGNVASRGIYDKSGPKTGPGLDTLAKNQGAMREGVGMLPPKDVTIQDGAITAFEEAALVVDTEGGAAADDLNVISDVISATEKLHPGMLITLRAKDPARVVTVKNSASANGVNTADGNDIVLSPGWELMLRLVGGRWYEVRGVPAGTEGVAGRLRIATKNESLAGTNDNSAMTPLKTRQAYTDLNTYSSTEQNTEEKWTDGKGIYRKTISLGQWPNSTTKLVPHGIVGLDKVLKFYGIAHRPNDNVFFPLPFVALPIEGALSLAVAGSNVQMITYSDRTAIVSSWLTLEYTKTT